MEKTYENDLTYKIRGVFYDVYKELGPGLLESMYVNAVCYELNNKSIKTKREVPLAGVYKGVNLGLGFRIDILVEDTIIVEVKSVEQLAPVHFKQLTTYLKLADKRVGLLVNFNTDDITKSIHRKVFRV